MMRNARTSRGSVIVGANAAFFAALLAVASCGSSGNTSTSPSTLSKCAVTVDTPGTPIPAAGGSGSVAVQTERECQWTAQPEVAWLSITAGSSGQGPGTIQFGVSANADPATRTGGVMVNGQRAQVTQAAGECKFDLSSSATSFPQAGGTGSVDVRASSPLCTWTATSDADWISVTSNASGKGSASVGFRVTSTNGPPRTGTLTIAGIHFSVTQSEGCAFAVSPSTVAAGAAGESFVVTVTTSAGCPWSASSNAPWISIASGSTGSGNGTVNVTVASTNGPSRSGTLTIAGKTVTVNQGQGCAFSLSASSATAPAAGATGGFDVRTSDGCEWAVVTNASWLTVTAGATGTGNGTVRYTVAANSGAQRSGTLAVGGQAFTVTQGTGCSASVAPGTIAVPASGGPQNVGITTPAECGWTAVSNAAWISIPTNNASGSGNATVRLDSLPNTEAARTGTATIAGQVVTVNQESGCLISLNPPSQVVPVGSGSGSVDVSAGAGCAWTAVSGAAWIAVTAGASGAGNGTVRFTFEANMTRMPRSGVITIGGQQFTINQAGS